MIINQDLITHILSVTMVTKLVQHLNQMIEGAEIKKILKNSHHGKAVGAILLLIATVMEEITTRIPLMVATKKATTKTLEIVIEGIEAVETSASTTTKILRWLQITN